MLNKIKKPFALRSPLFAQKGGQILVEALVAITIATVGLLGVFTLLSRSLSLNRVVADQFIASNLAVEGIEVVKNIIDHNVILGIAFNDGISNGVYKVKYDDTVLGAQISSNPDNCAADFIRQSANALTLTFDENSGLYGYDFPKITNYKRGVCVENLDDGNEIKVNSIVAWTTRGGAQFDINLEDHFFNWR